MMEVRPFPWAEMMSFGLGRLKLSPGDFWSLTLPELNAALRAYGYRQEQTVGRAWLNEAMRENPDSLPDLHKIKQ